MSRTIEIEDQLESLMLVQALVERREREVEMDCDPGVEACDRLLIQMQDSVSYSVQVSDEVAKEVEER